MHGYTKSSEYLVCIFLLVCQCTCMGEHLPSVHGSMHCAPVHFSGVFVYPRGRACMCYACIRMLCMFVHGYLLSGRPVCANSCKLTSKVHVHVPMGAWVCLSAGEGTRVSVWRDEGISGWAIYMVCMYLGICCMKERCNSIVKGPQALGSRPALPLLAV